MARIAVGVALLASIWTTGVARAADDETTALASEVGLDPRELGAAAATVGADPRTYLLTTAGEPSPSSSARGAALVTGVGAVSTGGGAASAPGPWQALAQCESGGRWSIVSPPYYGGLQEDMTFWRRYGGLSYASRPDLAPPAAQISVAARGQAVQGWSAWPACSRRLGLR